MGRRHLATVVTMLVLVAILVFGVVIGVRSLFAPLPGSDEPAAEQSPSCVPTSVKKGQRVASRQVTVSVFNGGTRSGLAGDTMRALVKRGFKRGQVGNAPEEVTVKVAQVWTTQRNDATARLVARQFGRSIKVRITDTDLGPGVDVVVGNDLGKLAKAKRTIVAKRSSSVCLPPPSTAPNAAG